MQREIVEYKIVQAEFVNIDKLVEHCIGLGWQPYRNFVFRDGLIYQAMVKYKETE